METSAFITYMSERVDANLSREKIRDMVNRAQNEILGHDNRITRVVPDPYLHTGSEDFTGHNADNTSGAFAFRINETIGLTTPTKGFLLVAESGATQRYKYVSYSGSIFTFADGVSLSQTYTSSATATVDPYTCIASGSVFSSQPNNRTEQYDIRRVSRVYAFKSKVSGWSYGYGRFGVNNASFRPDRSMNLNSHELEVEADTSDSLEASSNDCIVQFWRENDPGNTTDSYIVKAQRWPTQVLTEDIPLSIPDQWQTNLLRYAILRDIEYTEYGRDNVPEDKYQKYLRDFLSWAQSGVDTTTPTRTLPKEF